MKKVLAAHEQATFWRTNASGGHQLDDQQPQIALLRATYVTHTFVPHMHETFAVGMIEQGAETFHYRHAHHVAPSGSVVAVNPGEVHTGSAFTLLNACSVSRPANTCPTTILFKTTASISSKLSLWMTKNMGNREIKYKKRY